jgi:hypothetical protein
MSVNIKPSEIESIDDIGEMDGSPVKLVKCVGGFFMALGRRHGRNQDEALASGSHAAIVKYSLEKNFSTFRPAMEKSEFFDTERVTGLTELVPKALRNKGYELHALTKHEQTSYVITKYGSEIVNYKTFPMNKSLVVMDPSNTIKDEELPMTTAIIKAVTDEANQLGKESIVFKNRSFKVKDLLKK